MLPWNAAVFSCLRDNTAMLRQFDPQVRLRKLFERSLLRLHVRKSSQTWVDRRKTLCLILRKRISDISRPNDAVGREHDHPLHDIAEFPPVPGPGIGHKALHRLFVKMALCLAHGSSQLAEQIACDNGNILATFTERRDPN